MRDRNVTRMYMVNRRHLACMIHDSYKRNGWIVSISEEESHADCSIFYRVIASNWYGI